MTARPLPTLALVVLATLARAAYGGADERAAAAERVLGLLRGIASEYREAFDDQGTLARPIELDEASLLVAEARDLLPRAGMDSDDVGEVARAIETRASQDAL